MEGAGVRIAACRFLASRRPAADASVVPRMSWRPRRESISLGVSVSLSPLEPLRESACRIENLCVFVHPQQVLVYPTAPVSMRLTGRLASCGLSVGPTERRKAAGKPKKASWKEGAWGNPLRALD